MIVRESESRRVSKDFYASPVAFTVRALVQFFYENVI